MLEPTWKVPHDEIPCLWRAWLLHAGSFMQRLVQQGVRDARIQVLHQHWELPEPEERQVLDMDFRVYALIREVLIVSMDNVWMFARTVFPLRTLTGQQQQLARLKNRSLGSVLFKDPALQRSAFTIAYLQPEQRWHANIEQAVGQALPDLWARRSLFTLQGKSLLLTEVFLPDIATL